MEILGIWGDMVEFTRGNEIEYMNIEEFTEEFGMEALIGDCDSEEFEDGTIYRF